MKRKAKKTLATLGLLAVTGLSALAPMQTASAGILVDSAGKNAIDAAEADIKEIGGATIVVCCLVWGIRKTRAI